MNIPEEAINDMSRQLAISIDKEIISSLYNGYKNPLVDSGDEYIEEFIKEEEFIDLEYKGFNIVYYSWYEKHYIISYVKENILDEEKCYYLTSNLKNIESGEISNFIKKYKKMNYFYFDTKQSAINAIEYYLESLEFIKEEEFCM